MVSLFLGTDYVESARDEDASRNGARIGGCQLF